MIYLINTCNVNNSIMYDMYDAQDEITYYVYTTFLVMDSTTGLPLTFNDLGCLHDVCRQSTPPSPYTYTSRLVLVGM